MVWFLYLAAGYWAAGKTVYANKIMVGSWSSIVIQRMVVGAVLGIILIPIALFKLIFTR